MSRRQGVASRRARAGAPRARASSWRHDDLRGAVMVTSDHFGCGKRHQLPSTYNQPSSHTATTYDRYQKLAQRNTSPTPLRAAGGTGASRATARGVAPLLSSPLAPYPLISIHALHLLSTITNSQHQSVSPSVSTSLHPPSPHTATATRERGAASPPPAPLTNTRTRTHCTTPKTKPLSPASAKEHTLTRAIPTTTPVRAIARGGK